MKKSPKDNLKTTDEITEEVVDYQDKYHRAIADYQNLLKQNARDKSDLIRYANEHLLTELLPVYDFLKLSLAHSEDDDPLASGLKYVLQEFKKVLTGAQVEEIKTQDENYDFKTMEAVETIETADEDLSDKVAKELQPGYTLYGKVIRPARVGVYKINNNG